MVLLIDRAWPEIENDSLGKDVSICKLCFFSVLGSGDIFA